MKDVNNALWPDLEDNVLATTGRILEFKLVKELLPIVGISLLLALDEHDVKANDVPATTVVTKKEEKTDSFKNFLFFLKFDINLASY
ncbi:hypothetical protein IKD48_01445 [bacterium]|nr:hypothetical protein [bacterium]